MTSYSYEDFIKQYQTYRFIDSYTFYEATMIIMRQKENPFTNPESKQSVILNAGNSAFYTSSWADIQDINNLQSILHNSDFRRDFKKFRKTNPPQETLPQSTVETKVEITDWVAGHLQELESAPPPPPQKHPKKTGPCPWVLQKGSAYPKECWNHRYIDPTLSKHLEETLQRIAVAEAKVPQNKQEIASLHHIRRHLEASQKKAPEVCPWIHPDSPQWNAEWSVTHVWETTEQREAKWEVYYDLPKKYVPPEPQKPLGNHYGTEVHSYRIGEGTSYRNLVDGYKRDLLSAIQIAQKPVPRYPPRPPPSFQTFPRYSFQRV